MENNKTSSKKSDNKRMIIGTLFWMLLTIIPMVLDYQQKQEVNGPLAFSSLIIYGALVFSVHKTR